MQFFKISNFAKYSHFVLDLYERLQAIGKAFSHVADADPDLACHFDADPDPTFHFCPDPDPTFDFDADPDPACSF
jgi:hypothetical protein